MILMRPTNVLILFLHFSGVSFIIKKKALSNATRSGHKRASAGGFSYLREWMWWAGLITSESR